MSSDLPEARASEEYLLQAERRAVRRAIERLEGSIKVLQRKRSWRPAEKAMAIAERSLDAEALKRVLVKLSTASPNTPVR